MVSKYLLILICVDSKLTKDERREAILHAAIPLFAEKGLKATTKEIAKVSGVSEALLYKHFSTKEELFNALKTFCCQEADRDADVLVMAPSSLELLVEGFFFTNLVIFYGHPDEPFSSQEMVSLVLRSLLEKGDFAQEIFDHFGKHIPKMEESLNIAIEKKQAVKISDNPEDLFWLYHHMVAGTRYTFQKEGSFINYKVSKNEIIKKLTLSGLRLCGVTEKSIEEIAKPLILELEKKHFKKEGMDDRRISKHGTGYPN